MMERHVTDQFLWYTECTDENRSEMRLLYKEALLGDEDALFDLMNTAYDTGFREGYG